jgi:hypothetical protein
MQGLYGSGTEDLIQNFDFFNQLVGDNGKASGELSDVCECDFQIVADSRVLLRCKPFDYRLYDQGVALLADVVNDLIFTFEVDRAAHQNQRCIQGVIVRMLATCLKEVVRAGDDVVIDALLLAFLVNRHVAEYS